MFTCHFIIGVTVWLFSCSLIVASLLKLIYVVNLLFWSLWLAFSPANRFENLCKRIKKEGKEKRENVVSFFLLSTTTEPIVYFLLQSKTWILQPTLHHSQFAERNSSEFTSFRLIQPIGTWPSFWTYHFFCLSWETCLDSFEFRRFFYLMKKNKQSQPPCASGTLTSVARKVRS